MKSSSREEREATMKKNKGFSLVELIVVIAIMVVLAAATVMVLANQPGWRVKNATDSLRTAIGATKTEAMSKHRASLTITREADGYYVQVTGREKEHIGNSKSVKVLYAVNGGEANVEIAMGTPLQFSFDRSSGAFTPIIDGKDASGNYVFRSRMDGGVSTMVYCTGLKIECGNKSKELVLVKDTGKYYEK